MSRIMCAVNRVALVLLASALVAGAAGDETRTKGMIVSRTGERLIVNSDGSKVTVYLTDRTRTKDDRGLFGLDKEELSSVVLIPGLKVDIKGVSDAEGRIEAKTITVDGDDLETAEMIQSGLHPTAQQVAANVQTLEKHHGDISANRQDISTNSAGVAANKAELAKQKAGIETNQQSIAAHSEKIEQSIKDIRENTDRFNALSEFDVKDQATVKFTVGSTKLSSGDEERLQQLAQNATALTGYIIEVTGYTDSSGNAAMNTRLSENRAKAVITYLVQQGNVPVRHIVAPGAMGEYGPATSNETAAGRAENRRVEIKVLVNKGIAGQ